MGGPGLRLASVAVVAALLAAPQAAAYKIFQEKIPNGGNLPGVPALGHERPDMGGPNNDFGLDFIGAMFAWTTEFCQKDSDGDGQTNGQELGDPCCEFVHRKNAVVRWTDGISHPGDAEFKSDPALWEGIVCGGDAESEPATEAATEEETNEETKENAEAEEEKVEEETKEEAVLAVEGEADTEANEPAGSALFSSVVLSAVTISVVVVYIVVVRRRGRARGLPSFRHLRTYR